MSKGDAYTADDVQVTQMADVHIVRTDNQRRKIGSRCGSSTGSKTTSQSAGVVDSSVPFSARLSGASFKPKFDGCGDI